MAIKKIQIIPPDGGYVDVLHPETSASQVLFTDGKTAESKIGDLGGYGVASGTNTYAVTLGGIASLVDGLSVKIKFTNANTGASTLNINSLGAKTILKSNGNALASGNIKAGQICNLVYNGTNFQLLGEGGEYGTATASDVLSGKTIGTDAGLVTGTIPSKGVATITPSTTNQVISAGQYLSGDQTILGDADLIASNIKDMVSIFGVTGNFKGSGIKRIIPIDLQNVNNSSPTDTTYVYNLTEACIPENTFVVLQPRRHFNITMVKLVSVEANAITFSKLSSSYYWMRGIAFVVEFNPGAIKSKQVIDLPWSSGILSVNISSVDPAKTIVLTGCMYESSSNGNMYFTGTGYVNSSTTALLTHDSAGTSFTGVSQIIEFY